jgi:hypothetical protein
MSLPPLFTLHTTGAKDKERRDISFGGVSRTLSENSLEIISAYLGPSVHFGVEHVFFLLLLNAAAADSAAADSAAAIAACVEGDQLLIIALTLHLDLTNKQDLF